MLCRWDSRRHLPAPSMADPTNSTNPPSRSPERARTIGPPAGAAVKVSLGFVVDESDPDRADGLCGAVMASAPPGLLVEFLVLDDHTNPRRRELVGVVDQHGDAVRLVPRPRESGCARLDAVSQSSASEFIVLSFGEAAPWGAITATIGELWVDGADVVAVGGIGAGAALVETGLYPEVEDELYSRLAECLGLLGSGEDGHHGGPGRFVVVRRWVARWLFSEVPRDVDVSEELGDRARLLGLRMLVLDTKGTPITRT